MTTLMLDFAPLVPWPLLGGLLVLTLALLVLEAWRGRPRAALRRVLAMALLLTALANPERVTEKREAVPDRALLVVDRSASQQLEERPADLNAALTRLEAMADGGFSWQRVDIRSDGEGTRLLPALPEALAAIPPAERAGVVLVTDGNWQEAEAVLKALAPDVPVTSLLTGRADTPDRRVDLYTVPDFGLVGKTVSVTLRVADNTLPPGVPVPLEVRAGTRQRTLTVANGEQTTVALLVPHAGQSEVLFTVPGLPEELTYANNRQRAVLNGVRDRLQVLLVSGSPHPGGRSWRALLKGDPLVDLVHFTILRPPEKSDATPRHELALIPFPVEELFENKIKDFDLIIFDRYERRGVLSNRYLENMRDFVLAGGALLMVCGREYTEGWSLYESPLQTVLPAAPGRGIREESYRPALTEAGKTHPVTRPFAGAASGWGPWQRLIPTLNPAGTVLMTGPDAAPLLLIAEEGEARGRTAQIMTDRLWLWKRGYEGGGPYQELLRRLIHWLMKEPSLEERPLEVTAAEDETLLVTDTRQQAAEVTVSGPDGRTERLPLVKGRAVFRPEGPGLYLFSTDEAQRIVPYRFDDTAEMAAVAAMDGDARRVADKTGGQVLWLRENPSFTRADLGLRRRAAYHVAGRDTAPLLPAWLWIAAGALVLTFSWWREGKRT